MQILYKVSQGLKTSKWYMSSNATFLGQAFAGKMPFFCFKNNQRISQQTDQYVWRLLHTFLDIANIKHSTYSDVLF